MSEMIQQSLESALMHHKAGRLQEAEIIYRQILSLAPEHPDALHLLGAIALKFGQYEAAIQLFRRAINANPKAPHYYSNLGRALAQSGRAVDALEAFRQAIALNPDLPEIQLNIGLLLQGQGELENAIASYKQAILLKPSYAEAHNCLGNAYMARSEFDFAATSYHEALKIRPDYPEAHNNLGCALRVTGAIGAAIEEFRSALRFMPHSELFAIHLAETLRQAGQTESAREAYLHVLSLNPKEPETHSNLAQWLSSQGDHDQAIVMCRKAIQLRPNFEQAWINLSNALKAKGQFREATDACRRAISIRPDNAIAHFNLAIILLLQGNFDEGLREYEWRWRVKEFRGGQDFAVPAWDGTDLAGRQVLLYTEQGFGDSIQFSRYIPLIAQRCGPSGKIFLQCEAEIAPLLAGMEGIERIIIEGESLPEVDTQCALPSLPLRFATTMQTIPSNIPYLHAQPQRVKKWNAQMNAEPRRKVGLAWAGSTLHPDDRNRSLKLADFAALASIEDIQLYSLQKGRAENEAAGASSGLYLLDWTNELNDFADTAALIENLDLIISVDTSVAHLAGALGKPVWVLLPFVPDWRWMLDRADSPWYPTMRLFRQSKPGDWAGVVQEVSRVLRESI